MYSELAAPTVSIGVWLLILGGFILYIKFPKFDDAFYIRKEIKYLLRAELTLIISHFIARLILIQYYDGNELYNLCIIFLYGCFCCVFNSVLLYYVLRKFKLPTNPYAVKIYINTIDPLIDIAVQPKVNY